MTREIAVQTSGRRRSLATGRSLTTGRSLVVAVSAVALALVGCSDTTAPEGPATGSAQGASVAPRTEGETAALPPANGATLEVDAFAAALATPGTVVLDVRTPSEFASGHLEGAINLDVSSPEFAQALAELDPDLPYAVYCRSGNRSAAALEVMLGQGFTSAFHLAGGIGAWTESGRTVVT
jgi:rhodanese-related sulfurtransferase